MGSNISGVIKSIRNIFRKDNGLAGDAQRIEQLGWLIFLKLFDDKDQEKELMDDKYKSPIPENLKWRNWAANDEGDTGDELIDFVDNKLFHGLKNLQVTATEKVGLMIRSIFDGTNNYMKSGTVFREAINKLNEVDFNSSENMHTFNFIYEEILHGLAAKKDTGEFYTPRALTDFVVQMLKPQPHEKFIDFACGTGGFLVSAIEYMRQNGLIKTVKNRQDLQKNIVGAEYKSLPFMLAVINLIMHDIEVPNISYEDSLSNDLKSFKRKDLAIVLAMNPPFGATVADGVETNFPAKYRTKESADLFLIMIMQRLAKGGRAGIILPDGSLTGDGVKARIREKLLTECNVHTIIRLPNSVFAPYASVATNLMFFEKGKPTKEIWYYEHKLPKGQKSYSKTKPIRLEEFEPIKKWWDNRKENDLAWKVSIKNIKNNSWNLDLKNPTKQENEIQYSSSELLGKLSESFFKGNLLLEELKQELF